LRGTWAWMKQENVRGTCGDDSWCQEELRSWDKLGELRWSHWKGEIWKLMVRSPRGPLAVCHWPHNWTSGQPQTSPPQLFFHTGTDRWLLVFQCPSNWNQHLWIENFPYSMLGLFS
jgi:hypothetical protein